MQTWTKPGANAKQTRCKKCMRIFLHTFRAHANALYLVADWYSPTYMDTYMYTYLLSLGGVVAEALAEVLFPKVLVV